MYKEIKNKFGLDKAVAAQKSYPTICFPKWDKSKYLGGAHEYKRLEIAKKIDEECALKSASWGMFQIMGFNFAYCGCKMSLISSKDGRISCFSAEIDVLLHE